jgi:hypothetical protein
MERPRVDLDELAGLEFLHSVGCQICKQAHRRLSLSPVSKPQLTTGQQLLWTEKKRS